MEQNKEIIRELENTCADGYNKKGGFYANIKMSVKTADLLVLCAAGALAACLFGAIFLS